MVRGGGNGGAAIPSVSNREDGAMRLPDDPFRHRPEQDVAQAGTTMRGDHDEFDGKRSRVLDDHINRATPSHGGLDRSGLAPRWTQQPGESLA